MEKEHICITDKYLQEMKRDMKNPAKRTEVDLKMQKIQNCVFCKRRLWKFFGKEPREKTKKTNTEESVSGAQKEMVDTAARRIIEINMINPEIVQGVIKEIFGSLTPPNIGSLVLQRVREIYAA